MPSQPDADSRHHEPILNSGDPIEGAGHDGGHSRTTPGAARLRGLPLVFLSQGAQVYAGGDPFTDQTTIGDLAGREEVRAAERRAAQQRQPPPDAFAFFNAQKTELKLLLWTDRGFSVLHQKLGHGTFAFPRNIAAGERVPVEDLGVLLRGPQRQDAARATRPGRDQPGTDGRD
jgi:hypothetical protein